MNTQRLHTIRVKEGYHLLPIKPGMQLELHEKVGDDKNQRIRRFKGLVLKVKRPKHADGTFTIRGKTAGHTIEKIYPLSFQSFEKVILLDEYKIRRAKLYYLRDKVGKDARLKSLLTQSEKGVDLLALASDELVALQKVMDEEESNNMPAADVDVEQNAVAEDSREATAQDEHEVSSEDHHAEETYNEDASEAKKE